VRGAFSAARRILSWYEREFESLHGRSAGESSAQDAPVVLRIGAVRRDDLCHLSSVICCPTPVLSLRARYRRCFFLSLR
jgi:hypothetical protein